MLYRILCLVISLPKFACDSCANRNDRSGSYIGTTDTTKHGLMIVDPPFL